MPLTYYDISPSSSFSSDFTQYLRSYALTGKFKEHSGILNNAEIIRCAKALHDNALFAALIRTPKATINSYINFEKFIADEETGEVIKTFECEYKCEVLVSRKCAKIISTSAKKEEDLQERIKIYGYHRLASWVLSSGRVDQFYIFAVQRMQPYKVFTLKFTNDMDVINEATEQNIESLKKYYQDQKEQSEEARRWNYGDYGPIR